MAFDDNNGYDFEPAYSTSSRRKLLIRASRNDGKSDPMKALVPVKPPIARPHHKLFVRKLATRKAANSPLDTDSIVSSSFSSETGFSFRKNVSALSSVSTSSRKAPSQVSFLGSSLSSLSFTSSSQTKLGKRHASEVDLEHMTKRLKTESSNMIPEHPRQLLVSYLLPIVLVFLYVILWPSPDAFQDSTVDLTQLNLSLSQNLFGQPLAQTVILKTLQISFVNSSEPAVLVFTGSSGTGKTFAASLIARSLHVSTFSTFYLNENLEIPDLTKINNCGIHLLVFEDLELASEAQLDQISSNFTQANRAECSKLIVIFTSKVGQREIVRLTRNLLQMNYSRDTFRLDQFSVLLSKVLSNWTSNLNPVVVPFLPLEESHVIKCIRRELASRTRTEEDMINESDLILRILDQVRFDVEDDIWFAVSGCKRLYEFLEFHLSRK